MIDLEVGVLALQGAYTKHLQVVRSLKASAHAVCHPKDLQHCDALIIPGGESTAIAKQLSFINLWNPIADFAKEKPIFGTCAGMILMAKENLFETSFSPFALIDITVERNAYGRQKESFTSNLSMHSPFTSSKPQEAIFIRAPKIKAWGPQTKILATFEQDPVFVQEGIHLGTSFHPELTNSSSIHHYFIKLASDLKISKKS